MALGTQDMPTTFYSQPEIINGAPSMLSILPIGDKESPVDPALWTNQERMKRELVAWAKSVVAMAVHASMQESTNCK